MAELIIENEQDKEVVTPELYTLLKTVCEKVLEFEECDFDAEISITLVDNDAIREINREQRGIDKATDVLSFPMLEFDDDVADAEFDYDGDMVMLGDIVISLERAREQAIEYNHSFIREVAFLAVHSMLHLLGYDHVDSVEDERIMFEKQDRILNELNITREN
ncbi:MAG: rRNA maturation RNase YbeY [Clostridia bacterium]|nr:rRNA maturation RNase YbeY [Clostridia bacterium]